MLRQSIIYGSGHFARIPGSFRSGMLRFRAEIVLVFLWVAAVRDLAGVLAAALISTLPIVPVFAGMRTRICQHRMQFALFFAFATWLAKPTTRSDLSGWDCADSHASKFTILPFFRRSQGSRPLQVAGDATNRWPKSICVRGASRLDSGDDYHCRALAGYGFSVGQWESMQPTPENMPSFQHSQARCEALRGIWLLRTGAASACPA
jgi:hypothetical protein